MQNVTSSLDICQHKNSTTLTNLCFHHKFILDWSCRFLSQILVICGKFWFSAFIWRKLRLRLIECSKILTVRLLFVKEHVVRGFNASRAVILMSRTGMAVKKKISNIPNRRHYFLKTRANARKIDRIIESDSKSHFETPPSHGNDSEARKLSSVRVEAERCWTAFLCLWTAASKTESEGVFTLWLWSATKMRPLR